MVTALEPDAVDPGCMSLKGDRLLKNEQYQDGLATFTGIVHEEPQKIPKRSIT